MVDEESITGLLLSELYRNQETTPIYDNGCSDDTEVPFRLLPGEYSKYISLYSTKGEHLIVLTNYRLFVTLDKGYYSLPLGLIDGVEYTQTSEISLLCKDGRTISVERERSPLIAAILIDPRGDHYRQITLLQLDSGDQCRVWHHRLTDSIKLTGNNIRDAFAFIYYAYTNDTKLSSTTGYSHAKKVSSTATESFTSEYFRMGLNSTGTWRITECNTKYGLCSSYPKLFIVPQSITDAQLLQVAKFRSMGRVPAVSYRHSNGCVLVRSSQPMVGVLGWRCQEDETLIQSLSRSCSITDHAHNAPPMEVMSHGDSEDKVGRVNEAIDHAPLLLVVDLRSYTAVLGNRAKGGGGEHQDYYSNCEVVYKGLPNIHSVRSSFYALRTLTAGTEQTRFLSQVESTHWLQYISQLLQTALEVSTVLNHDCRPVLVHCSDGWDRTTQIVSLAQLILDPFYRTMKGFRLLVEREWLSFGHKFADRCGFGADGEQSPVFVQWLDCIHQLMDQFPCSFEFNVLHLVKLAQHSYTQLYGTFLANTEQERERELISIQTLPIWNDLFNKDTINVLYKENTEVLYPNVEVRFMKLWHQLYLHSPHILYTPLYSRPRPPLTTPPDTPIQNGHATFDTVHDTGTVNGHASFATGTKLEKENEERDQVGNNVQEVKLKEKEVKQEEVEQKKVKQEEVEQKEVKEKEEEKKGGQNIVANLSEGDDKNIQNIDKKEEKSDKLLLSTSSIRPLNDMEDSFRVITDANEYSLTTLNCSLREPHPVDTPLSSVLSASLNYSTFSECEGRLRLLGNDGLEKLVDPVQERVGELNELLWHRIRELENEVKRLSTNINGGGVGVGVVKSTTESCQDLTIVNEINEPSSPLANEWTYITAGDSDGIQWIPDHAVSHCKMCGAQFWMGKRKHHCRSCGGVFCWQCSNYYTPVPHEQLFTDQRVCKTCFDKLGGHQSKNGSKYLS